MKEFLKDYKKKESLAKMYSDILNSKLQSSKYSKEKIDYMREYVKKNINCTHGIMEDSKSVINDNRSYPTNINEISGSECLYILKKQRLSDEEYKRQQAFLERI